MRPKALFALVLGGLAISAWWANAQFPSDAALDDANSRPSGTLALRQGGPAMTPAAVAAATAAPAAGPAPPTAKPEISIAVLQVKGSNGSLGEVTSRGPSREYLLNADEAHVAFTSDVDFDSGRTLVLRQLAGLVLESIEQPTPKKATDKKYVAAIKFAGDGRYQFALEISDPSSTTPIVSDQITVDVRTSGPRVLYVDTEKFAVLDGPPVLTLDFDGRSPLESTSAANADNYSLEALEGTAQVAKQIPEPAKFDERANRVTLTFRALTPGRYKLTVKTVDATSGIKDLFGNPLGSEPGNAKGVDFTTIIVRSAEEVVPLLRPGLRGTTGPFVPFPEFTPPRPSTFGFNPSDHVETRVSRLYYNRDAHRVAQILNRDARSYNAAAVDTAHQLADKSRTLADEATDARRFQEMAAVRAAQTARQAEKALEVAQSQEAAAKQRADQQRPDVENLRKKRDDAEKKFRELKTKLDTQEEPKDAAPAEATPPEVAPTPAPTPIKKSEVDELEKLFDQASKDFENAQSVQSTLVTMAQQAERQTSAAHADLQAKRDAEVRASEERQRLEAREDRLRESQFRREVAAGHTDPDTYAPGKPESIDPVQQVSISVVGEGVIQFRGPLKGVNICRTMAHELDAPVGQTRIGIHTVQINGERGDRMEKVATRIQDYIDHSRFLTSQSGEMLRKAVVKVASRKAEEAQAACLGEAGFDPANPSFGRTQEDRDIRYLIAFFGQDFIDELRTLDSEFLRSGNKVLSLHSMDSTSLASALFLLALAKNGTRLEILDEFQQMLQTELPDAEMNYFAAGGDRGHFNRRFVMMANNARFQSFLGFFDAQGAADDTLTPLQREFIRLAQIFKARLVTELEIRQRVIERAVIEERIQIDPNGERTALLLEQKANDLADEALESRRNAQSKAVPFVIKLRHTIDDKLSKITGEIRDSSNVLLDAALGTIMDGVLGMFQAQADMLAENHSEPTRSAMQSEFNATLKHARADLLAKAQEGRSEPFVGKEIVSLSDKMLSILRRYIPDIPFPAVVPPTIEIKLSMNGRDYLFVIDRATGTLVIPNPAQPQPPFDDAKELQDAERAISYLRSLVARAREDAARRWKELQSYRTEAARENVNENATTVTTNLDDELLLEQAAEQYKVYVNINKALTTDNSELQPALAELDRIAFALANPNADVELLFGSWNAACNTLRKILDDERWQAIKVEVDGVRKVMSKLITSEVNLRFRRQSVEESRHELDHKKFLDMLIDDSQDKYIELLEGTRAHTANIDNYIKRLITALDDDFNTQFYYPAFRQVRKASRMWDVTLGQIETTTILANNREFAKVTPQATMEFDLPKRDILIQEAMKGAKAAIDDYGALVQDPSFLALAKLGSGAPTASQALGASNGFSKVRDVLPTQGRGTDEAIMTQNGPGERELGAALESLIPDPAVYKFETGTGFEIRPVIQPDGQAVVFHFNYMYTTNVREPVREDEKHLGRVKRHFIDTDVQLSNFEMREVSRYQVALKASRTSKGVPLLEDIPGVGLLFRPLPSAESSLQENIILAQGTVFPTLFDLMGLRWAPAVADLDPMRLQNADYIVRGRHRYIDNRVYDVASERVDEFLEVPNECRRPDLYRTQETINPIHPNGYRGPGQNIDPSAILPTDDPQLPYEDKKYWPAQNPQGPVYNQYQGALAPHPQYDANGARPPSQFGHGQRPESVLTPVPQTDSDRAPATPMNDGGGPRLDGQAPQALPPNGSRWQPRANPSQVARVQYQQPIPNGAALRYRQGYAPPAGDAQQQGRLRPTQPPRLIPRPTTTHVQRLPQSNAAPRR